MTTGTFPHRYSLTTEWRRFEANVHLADFKRGHILSVDLILGHSAGTFLIDDIQVLQKDPPDTSSSILIGFETHDGDVATLVEADAVSSGGGSLTADLASPAAAHPHCGKLGGLVTVDGGRSEVV